MNRYAQGPVILTRKRRSPLKLVFIFAIVLAVIGLIWAGYVWWKIENTNSSRLDGTSDVAIVLGASMWGDAPSPGLKERLDETLRLYREKRFKMIIVSGGLDRTDYKYTEAEGMRNYLIDQGVPAKSIILENKARSTYENLLYSQQIMKERGYVSAVIITHQYHGMRSKDIANYLNYDHPQLGLTESRTLQMKYHKPREILAYTKWKADELLLWLGWKKA
ncbi:YdcF family protein [Paenibacillus donghaensis]|uniref:YdcF family protein n=1 Tax=Paenibacillus donghaensis TaxID=414771 RepID=UPI0018840FFA|nr:YdcF family protein [Paenibacillus donghaensis]MBE9915768.1 YdcF family protein [Paenibacillus donghaensis]